MNSLYPDQIYDVELITYAALLHDVRDHKYPESITKEDMDKFIYESLGKERGDLVNLIIENVSFSKEDKLRKAKNGQTISDEVPTDLHPYLIALRDADRLEAIGQEGIRRCQVFTETHGGKVPEDVVSHCHEKLLRLYNEHFIKTEEGRRLAIPLHEEIVQYVKVNESH